jgi:hypothetical protein
MQARLTKNCSLPRSKSRKGDRLAMPASPGLIPEVPRQGLDGIAGRLDERLSDESVKQHAVQRYGIRIDAGSEVCSPPVRSWLGSRHSIPPSVQVVTAKGPPIRAVRYRSTDDH